MTVLLAVWSVAQLPILLSSTFSTLIACCVMLGRSERPGTPTTMNACRE